MAGAPGQIVLRPYQLRTLEAARAARRGGARRILVSSPTGSGKTVVGCEAVRGAISYRQRVLWIAHRYELLEQFRSACERQCGITPGVIMAGQRSITPYVNAAMVQTRSELPPADLLVIDEAHRSAAETYQTLQAAYPQATVIGLTATPCRTSGEPLREHYDVLVEGASYSELIEAGAIVAPTVYAPEKPVSLKGVKRIAGDYHEGELEAVMSRPSIVGNLVQTWLDFGQLLPTVVFAVSVEHSRSIQERFQEAGIRCGHIDATTPRDERMQALVDLEVGKLQVLSNVGILCEGWDQPRVKCCVMARPTLSLTLWMQCAGRILRPFCAQCGPGACSHGSVTPILLDHAGNVERHGLPHEDRAWSLDGKVTRAPGAERCLVCKQCYAYIARVPCPLCGHTSAVDRKPPPEVAGKLVPVTPVDPKRCYYDKQVSSARNRGFKPGYASAKYKEKFGDWPPWDWSQATKRAFAKDAEWQKNLSDHQARKAEYEERARQREAEIVGYTEEPDETAEAFSGIDML